MHVFPDPGIKSSTDFKTECSSPHPADPCISSIKPAWQSDYTYLPSVPCVGVAVVLDTNVGVVVVLDTDAGVAVVLDTDEGVVVVIDTDVGTSESLSQSKDTHT
jgi:hypothetical protein